MIFPTLRLLPLPWESLHSFSFSQVVSWCNVASVRCSLPATDVLPCLSGVKLILHQEHLISTTYRRIWMKRETYKSPHSGTGVTQEKACVSTTSLGLSPARYLTPLLPRHPCTHQVLKTHHPRKAYQVGLTLLCCPTQQGHNAVRQVSHHPSSALASLLQHRAQPRFHASATIVITLGYNNQVVLRAKDL